MEFQFPAPDAQGNFDIGGFALPADPPQAPQPALVFEDGLPADDDADMDAFFNADVGDEWDGNANFAPELPQHLEWGGGAWAPAQPIAHRVAVEGAPSRPRVSHNRNGVGG